MTYDQLQEGIFRGSARRHFEVPLRYAMPQAKVSHVPSQYNSSRSPDSAQKHLLMALDVLKTLRDKPKLPVARDLPPRVATDSKMLGI